MLVMQHTSEMNASESRSHRDRFPAEIISHCIRLYCPGEILLPPYLRKYFPFKGKECEQSMDYEAVTLTMSKAASARLANSPT